MRQAHHVANSDRTDFEIGECVASPSGWDSFDSVLRQHTTTIAGAPTTTLGGKEKDTLAGRKCSRGDVESNGLEEREERWDGGMGEGKNCEKEGCWARDHGLRFSDRLP